MTAASEDLLAAMRLGLLQLMEETLHSNQGMYTEEGTSWIETLDSLDATVASRAYPGLGQTIAGHAHHARFYLRNTLDFLQGRTNGDFDVAASWRVTQVSDTQWDDLRAELKATYSQVMGFIQRIEGPEPWPAVIAMIAHSAYHLGAIRQLKDLILPP